MREKGVSFIFCLIKQYPNLPRLKNYTEAVRVKRDTTTTVFEKRKEIVSPPQETEELKQHIHDLEELITCKICLSRCVNIVFIPCGHLCTFSSYALFLKDSPLCRGNIENIYKSYVG